MKTDKKIIPYTKLESVRRIASRQGQSIVLTTGCFDLLHLGHLVHFTFCKNHGDVFVVGIGTDKNVRKLKGSGRPIINQKARARMIAALSIVDYVVISRESGPVDFVDLAARLRPDVFVVPGTDKNLLKKKGVIHKVGGRVIFARRLPPREYRGRGISTTQILNKIA